MSSRMNTKQAKVLHEVCGRPMLAYVLDACRAAGTDKIYVVVGYGAEQVKDRFSDAEDIVWVEQKQQRGTADAVMCCQQYLGDFEGQTLVLCGDGPLIRAKHSRLLSRNIRPNVRQRRLLQRFWMIRLVTEESFEMPMGICRG